MAPPGVPCSQTRRLVRRGLGECLQNESLPALRGRRPTRAWPAGEAAKAGPGRALPGRRGTEAPATFRRVAWPPGPAPPFRGRIASQPPLPPSPAAASGAEGPATVARLPLGLHGSRGSSGRAGPFLLGRAPALEPQLRVTELSGSRGVPAGGRASRRCCDRGPSARLGGGAGRTGGGVARRTQAEAPREPGGPGQAQGRRAVRSGAASGGAGRFAAAGHGHARAPRTPQTAERAGRGSAASEYLWIPLF